MKKLFKNWKCPVQFLDVLVRQAHPGPGFRPYRNFKQKMQDARLHQQQEQISWPVLVDDVEGSAHQTYGGLSDPIYLIDMDGRVSFYNMWAHAPTVHTAIRALSAQGWRGVVKGGRDHIMHLLPAITGGWPAIRRGLPQSFLDLETAAPGMGSSIWLGNWLRPVLAPFTQGAKPLPKVAKLTLLAGVAGAVALAIRRQKKR